MSNDLSIRCKWNSMRLFRYAGGSINLCPSSLDFGSCGCLSNTVLHEITHGCGEKDESCPNCVADECTSHLPGCDDARLRI